MDFDLDIEEEKREYMREKKANSRQQSLSPMPRNREVSKSLESQSTSQSHMRARGRPPLSNKGPRSPTSTRRANTELQDQRRRASHISNVRRAAALKRHHPLCYRGHNRRL